MCTKKKRERERDKNWTGYNGMFIQTLLNIRNVDQKFLRAQTKQVAIKVANVINLLAPEYYI